MRSFMKVLAIAGVLAAVVLSHGEADSQSAGPCQTHDDCGGQNICMVGSCVFAFGRDYSVTVATAQGIPERKPNGSPWDALGGLPDPFVLMEIDGQRYQTHSVSNSLNPFWGYTLSPIRINYSSQFQWELLDFDNGTSHDSMIGSAPFGITVDMIKDTGWESTFNGITVAFVITPL